MFSFDTGVALITGGGSGIGQAVAVSLAGAGVPVVVADVNARGIDETLAHIRTKGGEGLGVELDVTQAASVDRAFGAAEDWKGPVTSLVNSAGILKVEPFEHFPEAAFSQVLNVNVTGSFQCAQRAASGMKAAGFGRIVNLSSVSGYRAGVGRAAYGTSKAAINGLTRQMALELGRYGITANAVAPGPTVTAMTEPVYNAETKASLLPMIPAGYLADPEDISAAIVFLLSRQARYINGQTLAVDGGYLASGMLQTAELKL
ncbi:SDR family NAD(P)-dependent oxidoreductase [Pseudooceanicola sp. C21-150M6]|uniref:SDR family NAD(P)-dependent oxidoreductase n=1 Tax=Pseudooceanicola sp. C21-150M6 TaxID=3434355 RepID=UPI003D7F9B1B